jgi:hypothetical protein
VHPATNRMQQRAARKSAKLYAGAIITTCFDRSSSRLYSASTPIVSPPSSSDPECKTCSA